MKVKGMKIRILSLLLSAAVLMGCFAVPVWATQPEVPAEPTTSEEEAPTGKEEPAATETVTTEEETKEDVTEEETEEEETEPARDPAELAAEREAFLNTPRDLGDVDMDRSVTVADARYALRISVGLEDFPADSQAYLSADVDNSGDVSVDDARRILRACVGLEWYEHTHNYYHAYCRLCNQLDPKHYPLSFKTDFERILYETSHPLINKASDELPANKGGLMESIYYGIGKWCCYYTIHHVFEPALQKAGYSSQKVSRIAPNNYDAKLLAKGLLVSPMLSLHVPSLLMDYYMTHPQYCSTYILHEFMDDVVNNRMYYRSSNADEYVPEVGDILFMSNKERTYVDGHPTVDHTAQIIQVYADGSFFCTEGCIINTTEPDQKPRVRERMYFYDAQSQTYKYRYNDIVVVLVCVKPDLSK